MTLQEEINQFKARLAAQIGSTSTPDEDSGFISSIKSSNKLSQAVKAGNMAPNFSLPDEDGQAVSLAKLLTQGPVIISFYRGGWCSFCNLELRALQRALSEFEKYGAILLGISPDKIEFSQMVKGEQKLQYTILSDQGGEIAKQYGLWFDAPQQLFDAYEQFGIEIAPRLGQDKAHGALPIPATYVVNTKGKVVFDFVDADHTKRAEPADIIATLMAL